MALVGTTAGCCPRGMMAHCMFSWFGLGFGLVSVFCIGASFLVGLVGFLVLGQQLGWAEARCLYGVVLGFLWNVGPFGCTGKSVVCMLFFDRYQPHMQFRTHDIERKGLVSISQTNMHGW